MKSIRIYRTELTTYCVNVEVADELAAALLKSPAANRSRLDDLCPAKNSTWYDAHQTTFQVEEDKD